MNGDSSKKLLVVDDSKFWRSLITDLLKDSFKIYVAESGIDGLKIATKVKPDIVITDYNMPDLNGIFLSIVLRKYQAFENVGIFILTSSDDKINDFWAKKSGANGFFSKSIFNSKDELDKFVNEIKVKKFFSVEDYVKSEISSEKAYEIIEERLKEEIYEKEILNLLKYIRDEEYLMERLNGLFGSLFSYESFLALVLSESEARIYSFNSHVSRNHAKALLLSYFEKPTIPKSWHFFGDFDDNSLKKLKNFKKYLVKYDNKEHALLLFENVNYEFDKVINFVGKSLGIVFSTINNFKEYFVASQYDSLTGLYNKKVLMNKIEEYIDKYEEDTVLAIFDIDNFKSINDTYGHVVGDNVLKEIANIIRSITKGNGICARYGGEEFVILFTDSESAIEIVSKIYSKIRKNNWPSLLNDNRIVTVSCGIARYRNGLRITEFINKADELLYKAKKDGKDRYYVSEEVGEII
ncbi:diguanylate cyclase [Thermosipho melanesiensis]|uniref:Response regulator receiver modulated diguanylate cyclase n=2 Tax=Thermosipho melanesiensis TaxID=46541 RepID=A6LNH9_THEM4|nr:diguanylate cyclase [Thermosipho melanesiensis]ABR31480.1 response regulator receiver modulated diguanylate cyclase [Thermosipho melanesiensis BI429]APT74538.1 histidine kinase [Thermosipho melanesiensis]OOC36489.1 diguanylate cyclase [Thermosipho melanesiensis]OOC37307.1 diguanylate cyclase [Thermosipho melanesiensis]OOC38060.1 diguanylate cyclase [Thermosipho melanesiensis]